MNEPSASKFDDELLSAYVDDELDARERAAVEERLRTDERARRLVDELRGASEAVKSLPREPLGRDLRASVLAQIEREAAPPAAAATIPPKSDAQGSAGRIWAWAALAIAAGLLMMVALPRGVREERPLAQATSEKKAAEDQPAMTREPAADRETDGAAARLNDEAPAEATPSAEMTPPPPPETAAAAIDAAVPVSPSSAGEGKIASPDSALRSAMPAPMSAPGPPGARGGVEGAPADGRNNEQVRERFAAAEPAPRGEADADELPVRVVVGAAAAQFEQILAEQKIELRQRDLPTAVAETLAEAAGDDESAGQAVLVEGTREQIDAVLVAIAANRDAEAAADRARYAEPSRRGGVTPGIAWRLAPGGRAEQGEADEQRADARAADAPVTLQAAPSAAQVEPTPRVRVLFLLQPKSEAATPSR